MSYASFVYVTYISTTPEKLWGALTNLNGKRALKSLILRKVKLQITALSLNTCRIIYFLIHGYRYRARLYVKNLSG
jgi:hypothetical protein